ncbi:MAG: phosphatase PAP2 family protein [Acidobacteria bacterium]|nr:phosphatase PAP2 family protein [Acidobacteriota bacterium]
MKPYLVFLVAAALFLLVAVLLGLQAKGAGPLPGDLEFSRAIQSVLPPGEAIRQFWVVVGEMLRYSPYLAVALALGLRKWDWAALLIVACLPIALFGETQLKPLFNRPRPTEELVTIIQAAKGLSFPSGAALNAMAVYGTTIYLSRLVGTSGGMIARIVTALSVTLLVLSGIGRVYVGAHWATDIFGGWLFSSAWLALLLAGHQWWLQQSEAANSEVE